MFESLMQNPVKLAKNKKLFPDSKLTINEYLK